jgi:hypothetical protein
VKQCVYFAHAIVNPLVPVVYEKGRSSLQMGIVDKPPDGDGERGTTGGTNVGDAGQEDESTKKI